MAKRYSSFTPQSEKWLRKSERLFKQAEDLRKERKYKKAKELEQEAEELRTRGLEERAKNKLQKINEELSEAAVLPSITEELWAAIREKCDEVEEAINKRKNGTRGINTRLANRFNRFPDEWDSLFDAFHDWVMQKFQSDEHFFQFLERVEEITGYDLVANSYWFGSSDFSEVNNTIFHALKQAENEGLKEAEELAELIEMRDELLEEYDDINSEFQM